MKSFTKMYNTLVSSLTGTVKLPIKTGISNSDQLTISLLKGIPNLIGSMQLAALCTTSESKEERNILELRDKKKS